MKNRRLLFILSSAGLLVLGCQKGTDTPLNLNAAGISKTQSNYDLAIQSGISNWEYPKEFNRLFPKALNVISYYTGAAGKSRWKSVVGFDNRHILRLVLPMELDAARTNVVSMGIPEDISLAEFKMPATNANGSRSYGVNIIATLSAEDWRRFVEAKGDFGVLGIKLETNQPPIDGFEQAWPSF